MINSLIICFSEIIHKQITKTAGNLSPMSRMNELMSIFRLKKTLGIYFVRSIIGSGNGTPPPR